MCTCTHTHALTRTHTLSLSLTHTRKHYTFINKYICMHTYTHSHTHGKITYIHINMYLTIHMFNNKMRTSAMKSEKLVLESGCKPSMVIPCVARRDRAIPIRHNQVLKKCPTRVFQHCLSDRLAHPFGYIVAGLPSTWSTCKPTLLPTSLT